MIESPLVVVLALLIFVVIAVVVWLVWRFIVEPRLKARDPRHMIENTVGPEEPASQHVPSWQSVPFMTIEPGDSEPPPVSQAVKAVNPRYAREDALRRR